MDFRINRNSDIDLRATLQKAEQERVKNISRYRSMDSARRIGEDYLTLSNYAIEFKDLKGMLERQPQIRKDEATKSNKEKPKKQKKGKYKNDSEEEDVKEHIDQWG